MKQKSKNDKVINLDLAHFNKDLKDVDVKITNITYSLQKDMFSITTEIGTKVEVINLNEFQAQLIGFINIETLQRFFN